MPSLKFQFLELKSPVVALTIVGLEKASAYIVQLNGSVNKTGRMEM